MEAPEIITMNANIKVEIENGEEQPNYVKGKNILTFEEEAVCFIKPERSDPVVTDREEDKVHIEEMIEDNIEEMIEGDIEVMIEEDTEEVQVLLTKFDKFTCAVCHRELDSNGPMVTYKHCNEIVLFCNDCNTPKGNKFTCVKCTNHGFGSTFQVSLTKLDKFPCVVCDRDLETDGNPMATYKHYNEIVLFCNYCIKPKGKKFICAKCNHRFGCKFSLIHHVDGVHRKLKKYKCEECDRAFSRRATLKLHVQSVHRKLKHACQQCTKVFSTRDYLSKHVNFTHRQLKVVTCDFCNKEFPSQKQLKRHIDGVHRKIREYECKECKRAFFFGYNLTRHVNSVHRKLKPFACDKCDRSFARRLELKIHNNFTHLKMKYTCADCNKAFARKEHLRRHINTIHRNNKPVVCIKRKHVISNKSNHHKRMTSAKCQLKNIEQSKSNRRQ